MTRTKCGWDSAFESSLELSKNYTLCSIPTANEIKTRYAVDAVEMLAVDEEKGVNVAEKLHAIGIKRLLTFVSSLFA